MTAGFVQIPVDEQSVHERLDVFLARRLCAFSRAKIQKAIASGFVQVNAASANKKTHICPGDIITVDMEKLNHIESSHLVPQNIPVAILYEDEYLMAVNKPAAMVVHPGNANRDGTLVHALLYHSAELSQGFGSDRPGIVHRLDKDTSGVILVAKNDETHRALATLFSSRSIKKRYIGICCGKRPDAHGSVDNPLGRSRRDPVRRSVRADGKQALTEYDLVAFRSGISVIRFIPHTGRTHQIRVHASACGFPVVCDPLYNGGKEAVQRIAVMDRAFANAVFKCFARHALHANSIEFEHPFTRGRMFIRAPFPDDFLKALSLFDGKEKGELLQLASGINC
jgi:23S rRNA pseudouridine1911/1915/1917 synthase